MIIDPAQLNHRVRFEPRADQDADDLGNEQGPYDQSKGVTRWAKYLMRPGSEAIVNARMQGEQPVTMIVRSDSETRTITPDWRAIDVDTSEVYAIRGVADVEDPDYRPRTWLNLYCEGGVEP